MRRNMDHPEMRNTVFGEVLAEMLEVRGLPVAPFEVGKLAEDAGMDGWKVINRMANAGAEYAGPLDGLARALGLSRLEMRDLALAFAFEDRRAAEPYAEILGTVNAKLGGAIDLLDDVPPEAFGDEGNYWRAKRAIAEAGGLVVEAQSRVSDRGRPTDARGEEAS